FIPFFWSKVLLMSINFLCLLAGSSCSPVSPIGVPAKRAQLQYLTPSCESKSDGKLTQNLVLQFRPYFILAYFPTRKLFAIALHFRANGRANGYSRSASISASICSSVNPFIFMAPVGQATPHRPHPLQTVLMTLDTIIPSRSS
ncbi:hypothetical protein HKBW3S42_02169, partial [Candidatus Hakubella thermalkaliphila]